VINAILPKGSIDLDGGPPSDTNPSLLFDVFGSVEGLTIIPPGPKEILVSPLTELYMPEWDPNAPTNKPVVGFPLMKRNYHSHTFASLSLPTLENPRLRGFSLVSCNVLLFAVGILVTKKNI